MSATVDPDLRLVCLAALAWQWEHDHPGEHAELFDLHIDTNELAAALDRLAGVPTSASPSSSGEGDGAVGGTVSAPAGAGGSPTAPLVSDQRPTDPPNVLREVHRRAFGFS